MADVAFAISLQDEVSAGARSASASLGQTEAALKQTGAAGDSVAGKMANVGASATKAANGGATAARSFRDQGREAGKLSHDVERLAKAQEKADAKKLAASQKEAAQAMAQAAKAAEKNASAVAKIKASSVTNLGGAAKAASPKLGEFLERGNQLSQALPGIPPAAGAAAMALLAVGIAGLKAAAGFAKFALDAADARRHLLAVSTAQTESVKIGAALASVVERTAHRTGMSADKVSEYAGELWKAGVRGQDLKAALAVAAGTARVLGDSAGSAFTKTAIDAHKAGKSVLELAEGAKTKLRPALMLELSRPSVALERMKSAAAGLFDTTDASGFAAGLNTITSMLEKGSAVGDAMREVFSALFGSLGSGAQSGGSFVVALIEHMTIMALRLAIVLKPLGRSFMALWNDMAGGEVGSTIAELFSSVLMPALAGVATVAGVVAAGFALLGGAIALVLAGVGAVAGALVAAGYGIAAGIAAIVDGAVAAYNAVAAFASSVTSPLSNLGSAAMEAAGNFISGLVSGITGGVGMVVDAIKGLASNALGAFKGILGIASPSKVMLQMGGYTAEGFAGGMDAGAAVVESSASTLAAAPIEAAKAAPPAALPAPRAAGGGGGGAIDIGGVQITINGVAGAEAILEKLPAALADAFEQIAETMGIQPAEA